MDVLVKLQTRPFSLVALCNSYTCCLPSMPCDHWDRCHRQRSRSPRQVPPTGTSPHLTRIATPPTLTVREGRVHPVTMEAVSREDAISWRSYDTAEWVTTLRMTSSPCVSCDEKSTNQCSVHVELNVRRKGCSDTLIHSFPFLQSARTIYRVALKMQRRFRWNPVSSIDQWNGHDFNCRRFEIHTVHEIENLIAKWICTNNVVMRHNATLSDATGLVEVTVVTLQWRRDRCVIYKHLNDQWKGSVIKLLITLLSTFYNFYITGANRVIHV